MMWIAAIVIAAILDYRDRRRERKLREMDRFGRLADRRWLR